jgi:excisionase family DNA binding protein
VNHAGPIIYQTRLTEMKNQSEKSTRATLSPRETMPITGFGVAHTYRLLREGVIPNIRVGKKIYVPRTALMRWLDSCGGGDAA